MEEDRGDHNLVGGTPLSHLIVLSPLLLKVKCNLALFSDHSL